MRYSFFSILMLSTLILTSDALASDAGGEVTTNSIGMKLKLIPAGSFMMGSPDTERDNRNDQGPVHKVTIGVAAGTGRMSMPDFCGNRIVSRQTNIPIYMQKPPSYWAFLTSGATNLITLSRVTLNLFQMQ